MLTLQRSPGQEIYIANLFTLKYIRKTNCRAHITVCPGRLLDNPLFDCVLPIKGEILLDHGKIQIKVISFNGKSVKVGIKAPPDIQILRDNTKNLEP